MWTLVDSGAARSLLRRSVFLKVCKTFSRMPLLSPTFPLFSVSGTPLHVLGEAELAIGRGIISKWVVVEDIHHDAILGADLLNKRINENKANVDFNTDTLILGKESFPLYYDGDGEYESFSFIDPFSELLKSYQNVFFQKGGKLPPCNLAPLIIDTGDSAPIFQRPYRTPLAKRKIVEKEIMEMLEAGLIRPSASPYAAPLLLVPKKDETFRTVIDYRALNKVTKMDRHPLPLIQDIFDQLGGAKIFSTLDLKQGYHQLEVHPDSVEKTAFVCHFGQFEWLRMPMGVACGPPVFQREIQKAMSGLNGVCVLAYLDDLVVYSDTMEQHLKDLEQVFERIRKAGLTLKREKCSFATTEVELLGYIINPQGIKPNPEKVRAIDSLPPPSNVQEVRSFLGMTGYYRQTVPDYAQKAAPLVALTHKNVPFKWGKEQTDSFNSLKENLMSGRVMAYPQTDKPYKLFTDACDYACGAILVQDDEEGVERVIQYVSHQLSGAQLRWATIEKEAYAVVYALQKLRPYLYGSEFCIYTDHRPLKSLFTAPMKNTKIQRWAIMLSEFGADIEYRAGADNIRADMLSRIRPKRDHQIATIDTQDWVDADFPDGLESHRIPLEADDLTVDKVEQQQLIEFPELFEQAQNEDSFYEVCEGLLYSTKQPSQYAAVYPRLILPACFRAQIIQRAHKELGHLGALKTQHRVADAYVWTGMKADIKKEVSKCPLCAVHTRRRERVPMGEMPYATYPGQIVSADLTGPLVTSTNENKYILTILDHFSGWVECYPIPNKRSITVAAKFVDDYFPRAGFPEILITDNGLEFQEREFKTYLQTVGVEHRSTTPARPQSNGKIERFHRTIKEMLRKLVNGDRPQWESRLPHAVMAYRNAVSTVTGFTPFFLYFARRARIPLSTMFLAENPPENLLGNRLVDMTEVFRQAKLNTEESRIHNRARLERKANAEDIAVGDSVILAANEPLTLSAKWDHQYEVTRIRGTTYWLRHQRTNKEVRVHREKLRLVDPNWGWDDVAARPKRQQRPPLVLRPPNRPVLQEETENEEIESQIAGPSSHNSSRPANNHPATGISDEAMDTSPRLPPPSNQLGPTTPSTSIPMETAHSRYNLRKRTYEAAPPRPEVAKRLRIECLYGVRSWFSPHRSA